MQALFMCATSMACLSSMLFIFHPLVSVSESERCYASNAIYYRLFSIINDSRNSSAKRRPDFPFSIDRGKNERRFRNCSLEMNWNSTYRFADDPNKAVLQEDSVSLWNQRGFILRRFSCQIEWSWTSHCCETSSAKRKRVAKFAAFTVLDFEASWCSHLKSVAIKASGKRRRKLEGNECCFWVFPNGTPLKVHQHRFYRDEKAVNTSSKSHTVFR